MGAAAGRSGPRRRLPGAAWGVGALVLLAAATVPSAGASAGPAAPTTATWAEPAGTAPDYIFPFAGPRYDTVANAQRFWDLMYRPLYWFGGTPTPSLDRARSLATPPVFSTGGTTVTVTLRHDRWSDGEAVSAHDVMFFLNMLHAEKANWAPYEPGGDGLPDDITAATVVSPTTLTLTLDGPKDRRWFTDDQLALITPLPLFWDRTTMNAKPGSGGCADGLYGTVDNQCAAVFTFLSQQAGYDPSDPTAPNRRLASYATDSLWKVVDGPWHLVAFTAGGKATFAAARTSSGAPKGALRTFIEEPFASDRAELSALRAGRVDVGYLPLEDAGAATAEPRQAGPNDPSLAHDSLHPFYSWSIAYAPYNFDSTGDHGAAGPILDQLYVRQALQDLVDQPRLIQQVAHGYGLPTYGPVPTAPADNPYPFDPAKARALLSAHGWRAVEGGASACVRPGSAANECGAGIAQGARLSFTLRYADDVALVKQTLEAERADWSRAGVEVRLTGAPLRTVLAGTAPCASGCGWEMADWGGGWLFSPGSYPTGEGVFASGAAGNAGNYRDATADADIAATTTSASATAAGTTRAFASYDRYLASRLPVLYQPRYATSLTEVANGLVGVTPQNALLPLTPETWHWSR